MPTYSSHFALIESTDPSAISDDQYGRWNRLRVEMDAIQTNIDKAINKNEDFHLLAFT